MTCVTVFEATIEVGGIPVLVRTESAEFVEVIRRRYGNFIVPNAVPAFEFDVELVTASNLEAAIDPEEELTVICQRGRWVLRRGDFRAELEEGLRRGRIVLDLSPFAIDAVLRILHSLLLVDREGLLIHASSAVRDGRAFVFAGVSGAGKSTMCQLAPPDIALLTDEISYIRPYEGAHVAYGTPFAGELGRPGDNICAPLQTIYLLAKGAANRIDDVSQAEAVRALMQSVLFFAHDPLLVNKVFNSVCRLVQEVSVRRLTFLPDNRVWELIR